MADITAELLKQCLAATFLSQQVHLVGQGVKPVGVPSVHHVIESVVDVAESETISL